MVFEIAVFVVNWLKNTEFCLSSDKVAKSEWWRIQNVLGSDELVYDFFNSNIKFVICF